MTTNPMTRRILLLKIIRLVQKFLQRFVELGPGNSGLLAASSGLLAIGTVYLYFVGFLYSYFFFQQFGVGLESLDLSTTYYLIHSYSALNTPIGMFFLPFLFRSSI